MGDWRTVNLSGTCSEEDAVKLREHLNSGFGDFERWGCLHGGGICGLPNWGKPSFSVTGNLGERGFSPACVAEELQKLAGLFPSLVAKLHYGAAYESLDCEATITLEKGVATVLGPEIKTLEPINEMMMGFNLGRAIGRDQATF